MENIYERFFKKVKGLGFVASILALLYGRALLSKDKLVEELSITTLIWVLAYVFHRLGGWCLDKPLYDRLFGPNAVFGGYLDTYREPARKKLAELKWQTESLLKTSEMVFEDSGVWGERVELALEISKMARTFVLPLLGLFIWDTARLPLSTPLQGTWLGDSSIVGVLFVLSLVLYLGFRVVHNRALYRLMGNAERIVEMGSGIMKIETFPRKPKKGDAFYNFYCQQVAIPTANAQPQGAAEMKFEKVDLELRRKIGDRFGEAESLFTQAPLARAEGRDADVVGLLGDARRRRVEIGDRPGIAECNAELARLPQRPVPA